MKFESAPDVQARVSGIVSRLKMNYIASENIVCMRSFNSKSSAIARIWALPRIWQKALGKEAHYIIEVISSRFDKMNNEEKDKTLIHELLHIPKTFSGGLRPHKYFGKRIDKKTVEMYFAALKNAEQI